MELNDVELVTMAKAAHDENAFATLVRRHQSPLRAFLRRLCGDAALADDIAQETFMKAHSSLTSFKGGGSFRSWLYSIAYREFLQDRRKAKAAARLEDALTQEAKQASGGESLEEGLSLDLRRALATLEDIERASILLCDAAGLSHSEAAIALDTPLGSIKTYVARARQKMRDVLSGEFKPAEEVKSAPAINGVSYAF
jgi:RNA polymerase sigma-70 factor (ECF subfamily)